MLLTNIAVAQQIAVHLPEQALLRRHDTPLERRLVRQLVRTQDGWKNYNLSIDLLQSARGTTRLQDGHLVGWGTDAIIQRD